MRIRSRKTVELKAILVTILCILPLSYIGYYAWKVEKINTDLRSFQYEYPPDPSTFIDANYTLLDDMARVYDDLFQENHLPLNFTAGCYYNENFTDVEYYSYSDNGGLWTGIAMAGWVFHYIAAKNEGNTTDQAYALEVITRMVDGMSMMVIVPNGGLGPEYPGNLARGWAGPQHKDIAPMYFNENIRHYNGTGAYSDWRWRGFTSNDEYGGFYMGMALALKYVDDPWVQERVSLVILQLANFMIETNFLGINGPGGPTGVNQKPKFFSGGFWVPLLLKMASIVDPATYEEKYYHWVSAEMTYLAANEGHDGETLANYYAFNFAHCVVFAFLLLEGIESEVGEFYYNGYVNSLRSFTRYHRNAWFNAVFLAVSNANALIEENSVIVGDIEDQLMRLNINHFPDRYYELTPIPDDYPIAERSSYWYEYFQTFEWGGLYSIPFVEFNWEHTYYAKALTVEYCRTGDFMWEHNPFKEDWEWVNPRFESPGLSFIVPYWIMRAFGYIPANTTEVV